MSTAELQQQLQATLGASYIIERELGGGGMSRVFVAEEKRFGRRVVVKVLPAELAAAVSIERFEREIAVAARLQHAHIVPVLSAGESAGLPYYTMPFVEGESLRTRLSREGELPIPQAVKILRDVASALAYAHSQGVVHRDIKPENILLTAHDAMVTDFGVAKAISAAAANDDSSGLTSLGVALGTPAYMAPEQASADPHVDQRADLYAFGCVAYEVLSGHAPFANRAPAQVLAAHVTETPEPLERLRPNLPPALAALVAQCLLKRPADRPQSADDIVERLDGAVTPGLGSTPVAVRAPQKRLSRRALAITVACIAVATVVAALSVVAARNRDDTIATGAASAGKSIAVLPFENVGGDTAAEYFADGMADELTTALGHIPGLRVAARSSAFALRGKAANTQEVAAKLHVSTILEGSVRRAGGRLRISAQLINASDGLSLWSEAYERQVTDVFQVQDSLAHDIAQALSATLSIPQAAARTAGVMAQGTNDLEAYDLYLRGRHLWERRGGDGLLRAADFFRQAVQRDPGFARAHAGLAMSYVLLPQYTLLPADSVRALAVKSAEHALTLDPNLPDAHLALGYALTYEWRWSEAEEHFRRALTLDSANATAHQWLADLYAATDRNGDALAEFRRAAALDPLSAIIASELSNAIMVDGQYAAAAAEGRKAIELDSTLSIAYSNFAVAYTYIGRPDETVRLARRALSLDSVIFGPRAVLMAGLKAQGQDAAARKVLDETKQHAATGKGQWYEVAEGAAVIGDRATALDALEQGVSAKEAFLIWNGVGCDPFLQGLHNEPRFRAVLQRLGIGPCIYKPTTKPL